MPELYHYANERVHPLAISMGMQGVNQPRANNHSAVNIRTENTADYAADCNTLAESSRWWADNCLLERKSKGPF